MIVAAALIAAFAASAIEVTLAPDQPVPFVYIDDPLIVEFKSDADVPVSGHIEFTDDHGNVTRADVPATELRANGTFWFPVNGAPMAMGRYDTQVVLDTGGASEETTLVFCRIERPNGEFRAPFCVQLEEPTPASLLALPGIPIRSLQLDSGLPEAADAAARAAAAGYAVSLFTRVDDAATAEPLFEQVAKSVGDRVAMWTIDTGADVPAFEAAVAAIRRGGCRAPISVVTKDAAGLSGYLSNESAKLVAAATMEVENISAETIAALRRRAEEAGLEGFPIYASQLGDRPSEAGTTAPPLVRQIIEAMSAGVTHCDVNSEPLYNGDGFGTAFVELSALVRQLDGASYVGRLRLDGDGRTAVFRKGARWSVAAWTVGDPAETVVPVGDATAVAIADDCNNSLTAPIVEDGAIRVLLEAEPLYFGGESGDVIARAARDTARGEARAFVNDDQFQDALPEDVIDLVNTVAGSESGRADRLSFFGLLRMFPFLEQQWHDGQIPREVAVPAIASVARLVRTLCVLEQEAGEPFIELLQETLARSGEYQSQYLTGAGGTNDGHERADWLSAEISRLIAEAKTLAEQGREIEAVGVASLAEWRARSLEFAARAEPEVEVNAPEE